MGGDVTTDSLGSGVENTGDVASLLDASSVGAADRVAAHTAVDSFGKRLITGFCVENSCVDTSVIDLSVENPPEENCVVGGLV